MRSSFNVEDKSNYETMSIVSGRQQCRYPNFNVRMPLQTMSTRMIMRSACQCNNGRMMV